METLEKFFWNNEVTKNNLKYYLYEKDIYTIIIHSLIIQWLQ